MLGNDNYSRLVNSIIESILTAQETSKRINLKNISAYANIQSPQTLTQTPLLWKTRAIDKRDIQVLKGESLSLLLVKGTPCAIMDFFIAVDSNNFQLVVIAGSDVIYSGTFSEYDDISEGVKMDAYQDTQDGYYKVSFDNVKTSFSNAYLHIYFRALEDLTIKRLHINYEVIE